MSKEGMNCIIIMVCLLAFIVSEGQLREAIRLHATQKSEILSEVNDMLTLRENKILELRKKTLDDMYTQYRYIQSSLNSMVEEDEIIDRVDTGKFKI